VNYQQYFESLPTDHDLHLSPTEADPIKEPSYYKIRVYSRHGGAHCDIEAWDLSDALFINDALLWNTMKYLFRVGAGGKFNDLEDLKKARQYLDRAITIRESGDG
tara:strand:+ start:840 stop:1154 length:315 start_codon:yes stop_codon:yes gene_type:complete